MKSYGNGPFSKTAVRPMTSSSYDSEDEQSVRLTRDQHICIQNVGMAAAFFLPIGLVAAAVALGTNYWFDYKGDYYGLFRYCNNWTQLCGSVADKYNNNNSEMKLYWQVGMPLEVVGSVLLLISLASLLCYPCHRKVNCSKVACSIFIGAVLMIGCLAILGGTALFTIFSVTETPEIKWSFYVNAVGALCALVATILFWVHICYTGCFDYID